jgi:hypothetical protein
VPTTDPTTAGTAWSPTSDPAAPWWQQPVYFDGVPMRRVDVANRVAAAVGMSAGTMRQIVENAEPAPGADPTLRSPWYWDGVVLFDGEPTTRRAAFRKLAAAGTPDAYAMKALDTAVEFADPAGAKGDLDPEGHWRTISGNHIHITKGGEIDAGGHPNLRAALEKAGKLKAKGGGGAGEKAAARDPGYTMEPARYAKGQVAIRSSDGSGFKTGAGRIAEAMGARYSGRENSYILSATKAERFKALVAQGWSANPISRHIEPPKEIHDAAVKGEANPMHKAWAEVAHAETLRSISQSSEAGHHHKNNDLNDKARAAGQKQTQLHEQFTKDLLRGKFDAHLGLAKSKAPKEGGDAKPAASKQGPASRDDVRAAHEKFRAAETARRDWFMANRKDGDAAHNDAMGESPEHQKLRDASDLARDERDSALRSYMRSQGMTAEKLRDLPNAIGDGLSPHSGDDFDHALKGIESWHGIDSRHRQHAAEIDQTRRELKGSPRVDLKDLKPGDHVWSTVHGGKPMRVDKVTHGGKRVVGTDLTNPAGGATPFKAGGGDPGDMDNPFSRSSTGYYRVSPDLAAKVADLHQKVYNPTAAAPAKAPTAAPAKVPAASAGDAVKGIYDNAATATAGDLATARGHLDGMPKKDLLKLADAMEYHGGQRLSRSDLADTLHGRIVNRNGATIRRNIIDRPSPTESVAQAAANPVRGGHEWKQNGSGMWAWHKDGKQVTGAFRDSSHADQAFRDHALKDDQPAAPKIEDHPEYARLNSVYGSMTVKQIDDKLGAMAGEIADHHKVAEREFNQQGGRRTGASVSAQAARDIGQERLLLKAYRDSKAG